MKNILHHHRYKIIGTKITKDGPINVDIVCRCGRCGSVQIERAFKNRVLKQAMKGSYLNVPRIMSSSTYRN